MNRKRSLDGFRMGSAGKEFTDWHGARHLAHHFDSGRQAGWGDWVKIYSQEDALF